MAGVVEAAVRKSLEKVRLAGPGEKIVVGVSGGPDSLCLLHVLCSLRRNYGFQLHVAHLHHGLRGAEADADAAMVRALAAEWALPCTVERAEVAALAREQHLAFEEAARRARYGFLAHVAETVGARCITVGHNADDQAETVLMHWIRGSGLAGLRGMLPVTPLSEYRLAAHSGSESQPTDLCLARPLLEVSRAEIEAYCAQYGLKPRFDRSNLDVTYFRNWLRHEVLPLLASHNPNVREVIRRTARVLADDYALLRTVLLETWDRVAVEETSERIVLALDVWRGLPSSLQRSTIREAVHRLRRTLRDISFLHVENALQVGRDGSTGDQSTLPQGLMLTVGYEELIVACADAAEPVPDWPCLPPDGDPVPVGHAGMTPLPESAWYLEIRHLACADLPPDWDSNPDPWRAFVDAGALSGQLWMRTRQPGDRFHPLGMGGRTAKLSGVLTNRKVPRALRDQLPLLVDERGIVWVCGHRIDERVRVHDSTRTVLLLRFVRE